MRVAVVSSIVLVLVLVVGACTREAAPQPSPAAAADKTATADAGEAKPASTPAAQPGTPTLAPLPEVVATVGGQPIPRSAFELRYEPEARQVLARRDDGVVPEPFQAMQRRTIIDKLIWSELMALEAERSGVDYQPEALEAMEAEQRRHILDWDAWLARIGQTPEIRRQANIDYLRERALLEARVGALTPSEEQLRAAHEADRERLLASEPMVRASHILLAYGPRIGDEKIQPTLPEQREAAGPEAQAVWEEACKARALALRELALAPGVDFNEFAKEWSEGPGAFRGGDMGLFPRRRMVPEYADVAFALKPGEISQPVRSLKGYYVIKSFGHYEAGPLPYEAVRADLLRQLEGEAFKRGHEALRRELEERFVVVSPVLDDVAAFDAARKPGR